MTNLRDQQVFEESILSNGISAYHYPQESGYSIATILVPVGSAHSCGNFLPGTFHFLEHMLVKRSLRFPEYLAFDKHVGLLGGSIGASTHQFHTSYTLEAPTKHFNSLLEGFFSMVFEPVIQEDDIAIERGIIASERRMKERWFPGNTEEQQYLWLEWQFDRLLTLEQRLGADEHLAAITPEHLLHAHSQYRTKGVKVMSAGDFDSARLHNLLSTLEISETSEASAEYEPIRWVNREFHEKPFRDVSRYKLHYAFIQTPTLPLDDHVMVSIVLKYLCNTVHGPLYEWLREEKGWVYDVNYGRNTIPGISFDFGITMPLASRDQVDEVLRDFSSRIDTALQDSSRILRELERQRSIDEAYSYATVGSILNAGLDSLNVWGRVISEREGRELAEKYRDTELLRKRWYECVLPEKTGFFLARPEEA